MDIRKGRTTEIKKLHGEFADSFKKAKEIGIRIGQLLTEQKEDLKQDQFELWIKKNLPFSDKKAIDFIRMYQNRNILKKEPVPEPQYTCKFLKTNGKQSIVKKNGEVDFNQDYFHLLKMARSLRIDFIMQPYMKENGFDCDEDCGHSVAWGCIIEMVKNVGYERIHPNLQRFYNELIKYGLHQKKLID